jgi:UDP-N-acetylmuramate--alanine ligase
VTIADAFRDLSGPVHFMGIAGAGMISLAELMARNGIAVTGCDLQPNPASRALSSWGCEILVGHDPAHLEGASVLVVTSAVPGDHPEIERARRLGIPVMKRAEALGAWVNRGTVVAVAGTHGKTTTTAMTTEALAAAKMDPTGLVGGRVSSWKSNLRFGSDELYVVEADEYDRSFHHLKPSVAVLTNMEADHLDVYGGLEGVETAFRIFLDGVVPEGRILACGDDHGVSRLLPALGNRVRTFGLEPGAQIRAVDVEFGEDGTRFQVVELGEPRGSVRLKVPGPHNVRNALAAASAARSLEADWDAIRHGLGVFEGVGRRFEILGEGSGVTVVDDYAHHPTEIRATLEAARSRFPGRRIVVVFQPHLFSRTRDFAGEFGAALAEADQIWVTEIYPARENPIPDVSGMLVAQAALDAGAASVSFHAGLAELPQEVIPTLRGGDVCITMGAGSIEFVGPDLLSRLKAHRKGLRKGGLP